MALSNWRFRLFFFVRAVDATEANKNTFAAIFANYGSGEPQANERKLFDIVVRLSTTGNPPAQVYGINTAVLPEMKNPLRDFIASLPQNRYYAVMNFDYNSFFAGQLRETNDAIAPLIQVGVPPWNTTPFTWMDALADLYADRGLQVIGAGS